MAYETETQVNQQDYPGFFSKEVLPAGAIAGFIGGIGFIIVAMFLSWAMGSGLLFPVDLIGATVYGVDGLLGGLGVFSVGIVIHLLVSILYGIIFSSVIRRQTSALAAFWGGLVYGALVWVFMNYIVLPVVNPVMSVRVPFMAGPFFIEHLVYGGFLLFTPIFRRRFARQIGEEERAGKTLGKVA